jgi:hypothetical protein
MFYKPKKGDDVCSLLKFSPFFCPVLTLNSPFTSPPLCSSLCSSLRPVFASVFQILIDKNSQKRERNFETEK